MSVNTGAGRPSRPVRDDLWAFVEQAQAGDPDGFAGLYNATRTEVHGHLLRLVCDHHTAEDLTAETYVKAWRNLAGLQRTSESPIGWLKTIGTRLALSYLRRTRHRHELLVDAVRDDTSGRHLGYSAQPAPADADLADVWTVARDSLTEAQRDALVGRYLLDLPTWGAVGDWMGGRGEQAARSLSERALKILRGDPRIAALDPAPTSHDRDVPAVPQTGSAVASLSHEATADPQTGVPATKTSNVMCRDYRAGDTLSVLGLDTPARDGGTTMRDTTAQPGQVTIGKVTNRKGARNHLDINGRAHCGAGRGTIDPATRRVPDATINTGAVCLRCRKALRAALAARPADDIAAAGAAHYLQPDDEATAYDTQLAADIRTHLQAVHANRHQPTEAERLGLTGDQYRQHLLARLAADRPAPAGFDAPTLIAA